MKKAVMSLLLTVGICSAQELVFSNQTITVRPDQLSVESVEYRAETVVTNTVFQWIETELVTTNGMFSGETVETNTVSRQIESVAITTNAATWICNVIFELPKAHQWHLNEFPVTIDRFKARLEIPVSETVVQSAFPDNYTGLCFAASNGAYQPTGAVKNAFLGFAAAALAGGGQ